MAPPADTNDRETLRQHFLDMAPAEQAHGWNEMWQKKVTPWDRGASNPALAEALTTHIQTQDFTDPSTQQADRSSRKRALVPGCGRGYDVLLLARHGYDAFGLDSSALAIESARAHAQISVNDDGKEGRQDAVREEIDLRGKASFVQGDFFGDDFLAETKGVQFDLIYDYTFLCALPPALRPKWAKRMSELLAPGGSLVCVEFPLLKEPRMGGPPHGLTKELYEELLSRPGWEVEYDEGGYVRPTDRSGGVEVAAEKHALERVERWTAERANAAGQGSDCVSIWKHLQR